MIVNIEYDVNTGDYYIPIPEEFYSTLTELGLNPGDEIEWIENGNGSYTLKKVEKNE
jgi:bifunctional DNA-binding transcriptional regulator/antitoxin component of YhaV-PrlF toxin-antitoxin module